MDWDDYSEYENVMKYPKDPQIYCRRCRSDLEAVPDKLHCISCGVSLSDEQVIKKNEYAACLKKYREEDERLEKIFKVDAIEAVGLTGHPAANSAYGFAAREGYEGHAETMYYFKNIADILLIK